MRQKLFFLLLLLLTSIAGQAWAAPLLTADHQLYLPLVRTAEQRDGVTVGYATDATRTLIRWFCVNDCNTAYEVYRSVADEPEQLVATVSREANLAAALLTLNTTDPRWPNLAADLLDAYADQDVADLADLTALMDSNPLFAQKLTSEYYPLALVHGWGYLDQAIIPGATYRYRVVRTGDDLTLGEVKLIAGQPTPLEAPSGVQALALDPANSTITTARSADWGTVQPNRRFHQSAYLRWEVNDAAAQGFPAAWVTGYDIYRAPASAPDNLVQVNGDLAVQPIAATVPDLAPSELILGAAAQADYELIEHFYADQTATPGAYLYRVAPRDALGHVRQWPADQTQFSAAVPVRTYDFVPPPPPTGVQATVNAAHTQVTLAWSMPDPPADLAGFRIEQTRNFTSATPAAACASANDCWAEVATVGANVFQWVDTDPQQAQSRWYRVQALDTAGNRSMHTMPVHATLHDVQPPGKPLLDAFACAKTPSDPNPDYCLEVDADPGVNDDVTRYLIACTFEPGGAEIFLLERAAVNGALPQFNLTELYQPPFPLANVQCTVRAVDANGNISDPSDPAQINLWAGEQPEPPPPPQLTALTTTALDDQGNVTAEVRWAMADSPLLTGFRLRRERVDDGTISEIVGLAATARSYSDSALQAGELYRYTLVAELALGLDALEAEPRFYRALRDGQRPLVRFALTNLSRTAANGTSIGWNACPVGTTIDSDARFAVFRSTDLEQGYTQITPIVTTNACTASYVDSSAAHDRYFYSVMRFDLRTGEPIGFTDPQQVNANGSLQPGSTVAVPAGSGLVQSSVYQPGAQLFVPNCTSISPTGNDFSQPLRFGDGYEVHNLNVVPGGETISGSGDLRVRNNGVAVNIPVTFANITLADAQNRVCTGSLNVNVVAALGAPLNVAPTGGMRYRVERLQVRPFFANLNQGSGQVRVILPRSVRALDVNGVESDMLTLAGPQLRINADLQFSFQGNLDQIGNHGCAAGQDPILAFSLETLPVFVVPTGTLRMTPSELSAAGSCMDYAERYNPLYATGAPRPAASDLDAGDSNDGFLRGRYTAAANSMRITPAGLAGNFSSSAPMSYVASYPYGFSMELNGDKQLTLAASQIASGNLGSGTAGFTYSRTALETPSEKVTVVFNALTVDAGGALYATVTPHTASVAWMTPHGFVAGLLNSELYLGRVTSDQRPGQLIGEAATSALWATRANDARELNLGAPALLEPGLNLRRSDHTLLWLACPVGVTPLPATVDSYVRHGGISDRFQAQISTPVDTALHGYPLALETFDLSFLDSFVGDSTIMGDVALPFPADLDLRFIRMWFGLDGCVDGGDLLESPETLAYWNTDVALRQASFARETPNIALPSYPNWTERVLRTSGTLALPFLSVPGQSAPAQLEVAISFRPDGNPYETITLTPNRPIFRLDGFPLLLNGLRLSLLNEAADWDSNATAATPPTTNWAQRGFVEVQGAIAAPYFGLLAGESGAPGDYPAIQMQLHANYVGFSEQLKGARVWVDLPVVQVTHEFRNLVYAASALGDRGAIVGFREYEFVPDVAIDLLSLPPQAKVLHMDAAVIMEPQNVHFFLGQSAGVGAFRTLAEGSGNSTAQAPGQISMALWSAKLAMSQDAFTGYRDLTEAVWSFYPGDFRTTTEAINQYYLQTETPLPNSDRYGGGTLGYVAQAGVDFNRMRGQVEVDGIGAGMQLEFLQVAMAFKVQPDPSMRALLEADLANFTIERNGDYIFYAQNAGSVLVGNKLAFDGNGLYRPSTQYLEIGASIHEEVGLFHDLENWNLNLNKLHGAGAFGGPDGVRYFGAAMEASWNFVPFRAASFGGQILIGTIDPNQELLQAHFPDIIEHLHLVPAAPGANTPVSVLNGGYLRLYGDMTAGDRRIAKVLTVNGGARLGGWYWADQGGGEYYGGLAGAFVHTNYLKVLSARGDMTFSYAQTPTTQVVTAEVWVAGGIGSCEPETWTSWASRWWNDRWCWTAGGQAELSYNTAEDDFDASWQLDFE
jgi:hypothetical protein